jgi:predicted porin
MKVKLLALVISTFMGIGCIHAAEIFNKDGNKIDLNGKVDVSRIFSSNDSKHGDDSYARLGFKGETQISDSLTGYGMFEYQFRLDNPEGEGVQNGNRARLGFAGLKFGDYGSLDYGRNYGLIYDALSYTDVLPKFGGDAAYSDVFLTSRSGGVATWRTSNLFGMVEGLQWAAQYQGKNEREGSRSVVRSNGDGYATSVGYNSDAGISMVAAWASVDRTDAQNLAPRGEGKRAELWSTAIKYDMNQFYLAAMYGQTRNATPIDGGFANKAQNFEAVAQYLFLNGLQPSLAYVASRAKDIEGVGDADIYKYANIGAKYFMNVNMVAYIEHRINLLKEDNPLGLPTDDITGIGLIYQF